MMRKPLSLGTWLSVESVATALSGGSGARLSVESVAKALSGGSGTGLSVESVGIGGEGCVGRVGDGAVG